MLPRFNFTAAILLVALAGLMAYGPLFFRAEPLERDDQSLVGPLAHMSSPASYFTAWAEGKALDVAPVRDLTYLADLRFSRALGAPTFTFTNYLLWLCFAALALRLFAALELGNGALWLLTLVLACHPVYAVSVAWIASRKHLLAGLFCLAATLGAVKNRRGTSAWYSLSVLSHPVHLLWPLWHLAYLRCERRRARAALAGIAVMIPAAAVNAWYYGRGPYLAASAGLGKFSESGGLWVGALALSRSIFNLLMPATLSPVDYFPGSPANFAGIPLLLAAVAVFIHRVPPRKLVPWLLFFLLPLALLNWRSTRIFLSDTYLLVPSLGLWILITFAASDLVFPKTLTLLLAAGGLWSTHVLAVSFASMDRLFALAYRREPTPQVSYVHAKILLERGALQEAAETAYPVVGQFPPAEGVFAQAVALDENLTPAQRLSLLERVRGQGAVYHYFHADVLARAGRAKEAWAELKEGKLDVSEFGAAIPQVRARVQSIAREAGENPRGGGQP